MAGLAGCLGVRELPSRRVASDEGVRDVVVRLRSRVAAELRSGVIVVVVFVGPGDDGESGAGAVFVFRLRKDRASLRGGGGGGSGPRRLIGQAAIT